ncbi:GNAT family N-acetyltransferase [Acinetobacter pseudolwoffii]|uniref:GNAT family N-acetyltransferase n=1 Tax=Acinetobacter pseudolwoffii TaxID=2053287 RepID=UPI0021E37073|nr:GNAT family N-acetyltransferase [Acinetobacter pseudolwoffii]
MKNNNIRLAKTTDIQNIVVLINTAYRSNRGWTHEHKMVAGQRINRDQVVSLLVQSNVKLFVLENHDQIIGCIGLTEFDDSMEIGSFAIDPDQQNSGYGKQLLDFAESYILETYQKKVIRMSVLNVRTELIAYYQRRGYQLTEKIEAYPLDQNVGEPLIPLNLLILEKMIRSI